MMYNKHLKRIFILLFTKMQNLEDYLKEEFIKRFTIDLVFPDASLNRVIKSIAEKSYIAWYIQWADDLINKID